jgi:hypothetical protein
VFPASAFATRTIYDLYLKHGNTRIVKEAVDALGLMTPVRTLISGRVKGGAAFSYGHVYYILTNPVYAGRIRHHAQVYPGQHPPLIDPEVWDSIQEQLKSDSAKGRTFVKRNRNGAKKAVSPLAGKIGDQTGDRFTPTHSKTAKGRKLRYYVSHRLVRRTVPRDPSGLRLPAPELEDKIADLIRRHLNQPEVRTDILCDAATDETAAIGEQLSELTTTPDPATDAERLCLALVDRIDIAPDEVRIALSMDSLAALLDVEPLRINEPMLVIISPFQYRKRGVETKLIIGDETAEIDATLLRKIALAHRYFDLVRSSKTFAEIAETEAVSKRRVQQLIELAFLAPDMIRAVREGQQPVGMTSDWLKKHAFSPSWTKQRDAFVAL